MPGKYLSYLELYSNLPSRATEAEHYGQVVIDMEEANKL